MKTIATTFPGVRLAEVSPSDVVALYSPIDRNRAHLTQYGDWAEQVLPRRNQLPRACGTRTVIQPGLAFGLTRHRSGART